MRAAQPIGWSGGIVAGNTLFVGSEEGRLVAINTADSSVQWSEQMEGSGSTGMFGCASAPAGVAIYGTPTLDSEFVYIGGYNGKIYAFNSSSLQYQWEWPRSTNFLEPIVGGPVVAQGKVFFGGTDKKVYALDAATGNPQWEFLTGDKIWSTPAIDGNRLFVGSFDKKLYAFDATTGDKLWEFFTEGAIVATPLIHNNTVYIGSFDRHLYAIDATSGEQIWQFPAEGEAENKVDNWFWAEALVYNDIIYAGCLDGNVYILDAENGNEVATSANLGGPISSSPVLVNSSIIFATQQGEIYDLDSGSNELKRLASLDEAIYGPLYASEGIIYIHTQDLTLRRVNINTGATLISISLKRGE
jgi:outer membrane protein assembly factor BamB